VRKVCILGKKGDPVAMSAGAICGDFEQKQGEFTMPPMAPPTGKKVAVVGSGPAGLTLG